MHRLEKVVHTSWISGLKYMRRSKTICSTGGDGIMGIWGYDGIFLYQIRSKLRSPITSLYITEEENIIIGDVRGYIEIWAIGYKGYSLILRFQPHKGSILGRGIQRVGNSELYISGSHDRKIKLLSLKVKGKVLKEITLGNGVSGMTYIYM